NAELPEPLDQLLISIPAGLSHLTQPGEKLRARLLSDEVPEKGNGRAVIASGKLDNTDKLQPCLFGDWKCFLIAFESVVVGYRQRFQVGRKRAVDQFFRARSAV